ncbi:hypothetical protein VTL71DRAFT_3316 [Oculimacula yallundae]|uniref:Uncharacterized protein n=1 Tax=Oculimacula yallundae TaxID=86028 RepID=A0ABR4C7Y9_9HELO
MSTQVFSTFQTAGRGTVNNSGYIYITNSGIVCQLYTIILRLSYFFSMFPSSLRVFHRMQRSHAVRPPCFFLLPAPPLQRQKKDNIITS